MLSCAAKLFNTKGARSTTLADVAGRLGLTKTSLYYYVATKEDLIYQCYDANMRQAHAQLDAAEAAFEAPHSCLMAFLESQLNTTLSALDGEGNFYAAPLEVASLKVEHREALEGEYRRLSKRLIALLEQGIALGTIRPCNAVVTMRAMIGALDWSFYWLYEMPRAEAASVIGVLRDLFTFGLLAKPGPNVSATDITSLPLAAEEQAFDRDTQNRRKQEAFLKAGTRCFNQKGFSGTSLDEIAEQLQMEVAKVEEIMLLVKEPMSLDTPVGDDTDSTFASFIEDESLPSPEAVLDNTTLREQVSAALAELSPREEKVLRMRYGIGEPTQYSLEEIGARFFLTRERIRQIEAKALRKLRHPSRSEQLKTFLDS